MNRPRLLWKKKWVGSTYYVSGLFLVFRCTIVSTGPKIPIVAEFTQTKQADQETAMRVIPDGISVDTPV